MVSIAAYEILKRLPTPKINNINSDIAYVCSVYTKKEFRKKGYSKLLLNEKIKDANKKGLTRFKLSSHNEVLINYFLEGKIYMNIKINYDLVNKIYESNHGYNVVKDFKKLLRTNTIGLCIVSPMAILLPVEDRKAYFIKVLISLVLSDALIAKLVKDVCYENAVSNATLSLDLLSDELNDNNVDVTTNLLKEGVLTSKKYRFEYKNEDSKFKSLKEYKYVDVPLSNGYKKTLVQEHFVGSKDYNIKEEKIKKMCK